MFFIKKYFYIDLEIKLDIISKKRKKRREIYEYYYAL